MKAIERKNIMSTKLCEFLAWKGRIGGTSPCDETIRHFPNDSPTDSSLGGCHAFTCCNSREINLIDRETKVTTSHGCRLGLLLLLLLTVNGSRT